MDSEQSMGASNLEFPQRQEARMYAYPNRQERRQRMSIMDKFRKFKDEREFNPKLRTPAKVVGSGMIAAALAIGANNATQSIENNQQVNVLPAAHRQELSGGMPSAHLPIVEPPRVSEVAGIQEKAPIKSTGYELFNNMDAKQKAKIDTQLAGLDGELKQYGIYNNFEKVVRDYDQVITEASKKYNIPKDIIYGMIFIESSGNPNPPPNGIAYGIAQFREPAAEEVGVRDTSDPYESIMGLAKYVSKYSHIFGDNLGIGVANYHMGPGNMMEAIRVFAIDEYGLDPGDDLSKLGKVVREHNLNIDTIYSNDAVKQQVLASKEDDTGRYAHKTQAAANEFNKRMAMR